MSLVDPTANTVLLYSILTKESFGTTAGRIIELLSNRESCSLPEIVSKLGLRTGEVFRTLQLLARNQLVVGEGESAVLFRAQTESLERLMRHANYERLVEAMLGSRNASRILRYLLLYGTLRLFDLLSLSFSGLEEEIERRRANETETASDGFAALERESNAGKLDIVTQLSALCELGIVRARPAAKSNPSPLVVTSTVTTDKNEQFKRFISSSSASHLSAIVQETESKRQSKSAEKGDCDFLEVDFHNLDCLLIDEICFDTMKTRYGEFSAELVRAMLSESRRRKLPSSSTVAGNRISREIEANYPVESTWMRVDEFAGRRYETIASSGIDWSSVSDEVKRAHLDTMVTDSSGILQSDAIGVASNSQTRYTVQVTKILERLADRAVERVIEQRDGAHAARVYRCVRSLEYADLKDVESYCLLSGKEAKELTFKLLADHFIRLTELSRSGNFVSSQSLFLLRAEPLSVARRIVELASRTLHNLIAKRILIHEENNALFELQKRIVADLSVLQNEYREALRKIHERSETTTGNTEEDEQEPAMTVEELDAIQAERSAEIRDRLCEADRVRLESAKRAIASLRNAELRVGEQLFVLATHARVSVAMQRSALRASKAAGSTRRRAVISAGTDIVQQLAAAASSATTGAKRRSTAIRPEDESGASDGKRRRKM